MKTYLALLAVILFTACNSTTNTGTAPDSTVEPIVEAKSPADGGGCFLRLEGTTNQDSTLLNLVLEGDRVTGTLNWIPAEKDARKGIISGTRNGDLIKGTWTFMQEGMQDTLTVEFQRSGDQLLQKSYMVDPSTGRQYLGDKSEFNILFKQVACKK